MHNAKIIGLSGRVSQEFYIMSLKLEKLELIMTKGTIDNPSHDSRDCNMMDDKYWTTINLNDLIRSEYRKPTSWKQC